VQQIDLQPLLAIRHALWLARLFAICVLVTVLVALAGEGWTNSLAPMQRLVVYVLQIAIPVACLHILTLRIRKSLAIAELLLCFVICSLCVVLGFASVMRSVRNGNSIFAIVLAIILTVLVLYRVRRFMYPAERDPEEEFVAKGTEAPLSILSSVAAPETPGARRSMQKGVLATMEIVLALPVLIVIALIIIDTENQPSDYVWVVTGIVSGFLLARVTIPAFFSLRRRRALLAAALIAQNRSARKNGSYCT
jgi:hypothetical protein